MYLTQRALKPLMERVYNSMDYRERQTRARAINRNILENPYDFEASSGIDGA